MILLHSKVFVLLVGEHTRYLYKYVRWEIEEALKRELPCIVVNLNGKRFMDAKLCPPIIQKELAIHISFNSRILQHALENWPISEQEKRKNGKKGPYYYSDDIYERLGL